MRVIEGNATIIADATFRPKITKCLELINKSVIGMMFMAAHNVKIRAANKSGANFGDNAIDIAPATFNASETWLASVLVHETVHFQQYKSKTYSASRGDERVANMIQLLVLSQIGAPKSEIEYLAKLDGGHADLNGDGVYDQKDYDMRTY